MAEILPSNYDAAAQKFYDAGRFARKNGEVRTNLSSPSNPFNAYRWDQRWKTDPALQSGDLRAKYGSVEIHYYFGMDDEEHGWTGRGWMRSMGRIGWTVAGYNGNPTTINRIAALIWLYTFGWQHGFDVAYDASKGQGANPVIGNAAFDAVLTPDEQIWEMQKGRTDRRSGGSSPMDGYIDPASGGIPAKGSGPTGQPSSSAPYQPAYQPFQGGGSGFGSLDTLLPLLVIKKLTDSKDDEEDYDDPPPRRRRRSRRNRRSY